MTTVYGVRNRPGPYAPRAFTADGTAEFPDYKPDKNGVSQVTLIWRADQPGTMRVYRIDMMTGVEVEKLHLEVAIVAASTDDERTDIVYRPTTGKLRFRFTNSNATPGTLEGEVTDNRRS